MAACKTDRTMVKLLINTAYYVEDDASYDCLGSIRREL